MGGGGPKEPELCPQSMTSRASLMSKAGSAMATGHLASCLRRKVAAGFGVTFISATGSACARRWREAAIGAPGQFTGPRYSLPLGFRRRKIAWGRDRSGARRSARRVQRPLAKRDFLANFRIARNLFVHSRPVEADRATADSAATADILARAAIWLTPKSAAGFNAADFPELGLGRQAELQTAVQNFLAVATQVPADRPATKEQYGNASVAFARILEILAPYLPVPDEAEQVETALRGVEFPSWVVNWDYELASDSEGTSAVWVDVFADEQVIPKAQLGRAASELTSKVRQALDSHQIHRWPYIRLRTALEHKVG